MNLDTHKSQRVGRGRRLLPVLLLLGLWTLDSAFAQSTNETSGLDYSAFKIISDRNIFNPRRSARSTTRRTETTTRRAPRTDYFALVGTMRYEKGPFAFFDGSNSEYRKALKPEDKIAGYTIKEIQSNLVKLASPTNELDLPVGMQLSREDEGEWHMSARPHTEQVVSNTERSTPVPTRTTTPTTMSVSLPGFEGALPEGGPQVIMINPESGVFFGTQTDSGVGVTNAAQGTVSSGPDNDVLRRLMQRREQENNQ